MSKQLRDRFRSALLEGIDRLEARRQGPPRDLWREALALEHVIQADLLTREEEEELLASLDPSRVALCREIFCALETTIENSFAAIALGGTEAVLARTEGITENYLVRYEDLARHEVALARITAADRALFLGSGPLPITAIEYHRQTGCAVDCVDLSPPAIETSAEVLRRLTLNEEVRPRLARAEECDPSQATVVLVGVLARPKKEIFENLARRCRVGCRVLARTTFGLRSLIYEPMGYDPTTLPVFERFGTNEARGDQVISAVGYRIRPPSD